MSLESLKVHRAALALVTALYAAPAGAAVFHANFMGDFASGSCGTECSLRDAITAANQSPGFDVVVLGPGNYMASGLDNDDLNAWGDYDILDDVAILGVSADKTSIQGSLERVFDIASGVSVEIVGVRIYDGQMVSGNGAGIRNAGRLTLTRVQISGNRTSGGSGGGIYSNGSDAALLVRQSLISGNVAGGEGGGIAVGESLTLTDSTISGNSTGTTGGGIHTYDNTDGEILGSTITANQAGSSGGGLNAVATPFITVDRPELRSTILAGNAAPADRDCGGAPNSNGNNLVGVGSVTCGAFTAAKGDLIGTAAAPLDPKLGPLADNGGTTATHALLDGSPAISGTHNCTRFDQRGVEHPPICDIGAYEIPIFCATGGPTLCLNGIRFKVTVSFKTAQGTGDGVAEQLTLDSGYFTFFDPSNVELTVKVLNGCGVNQRYWVFAAGMTNVEVTLKVTDILTGQTRTYTNPQGRAFRTITDTTAFACQ